MIRVYCTLLRVVCLLLAGCASGNQEPGARQSPRATATSLVRAVTPTATVARQCGQRRVSGKIVFAAEGVGGSFDLFVMNADGSGRRTHLSYPLGEFCMHVAIPCCSTYRHGHEQLSSRRDE